MLDTGDGNYDYVLNSVYPCWYGRYGETLDDRAGIVWLAKSQGYTRANLQRALRDGDTSGPKGFLASMRAEVANIASHMNTVTFLVAVSYTHLIIPVDERGLGLCKGEHRNYCFCFAAKPR